jgi:hypothetical protein
MTGRARAEREQRIGRGPYQPSAPVWTTWDLDGASATPPQSGSPMRSAARSESSIMTRRRVSAGHYARATVSRPYVWARHICTARLGGLCRRSVPLSGDDTRWQAKQGAR